MPSEKMHRLLKRQIKRAFGDSFAIPEEWRDFIALVNSAYHESDMDRDMLERSLDLSSQELMQANSGMWAIFEAVPDLFFRVDASGRILDCKAGSHTPDLFISRTNMIGRRIDDIPVASVARKFRQAIEDVRETKSPVSIEYSLKRHQTELFYEARWIPLEGDQTVIVIRNVTDRKDVENVLKRSEEYYREITMNSTDVLFIVDGQGTITYASPSIERITGYSPEELIGKNSLYLVAPDDHARALEDFRRSLKTRDVSIPNSFRIRHKNGSELTMEGMGKNLLHHPVINGFVMNVRDVTDRKRAEQELLDNEAKLQAIFDQIDTGIMIIDAETQTILEANRKAVEMSGLSRDQMIGQICHAMVCPAEKGRCPVKDLHQTIDQSERVLLSVDGSRKDILKTVNPIVIKGRNCYLESFIDISDRKRAEDALKKSEQKYRQLAETAHDLIVTVDLNFKITYANKAILKYTEGTDVIGKSLLDFTFPGLHSVQEAMMQKRREGFDEMLAFEWEIFYPQGHAATFDIRASLITADGKPSGVLFIARDTTERKQAEDALRESEKKYRLLTETMSDIVWIADLDLNTMYLSPSVQKALGFGQEEIPSTIIGQMTPESVTVASQTLLAELALEKQGSSDPDRSINLVLEYYHKDGSTRWMDTTISGLRDEQGALTGIHGVSRDITERRKVQAALQASEERYRTIFENTATANLIIAGDTTILMANENFAGLSGYTRQELEGKISWTIFAHPGDLEMMKGYHNRRRMERGSVPSSYEFRFVNRKGEVKEFFISVAVIPETRESIVSMVDLSERKQLETQLIQAQKMESVGRLAGGVAHDFNNMLSVIIGNTEMAMKKVKSTEPLYKTLQDVLNAGLRSADLTRQLLAFARKQTVSPRILDLNDTVTGMLKMLQRLIGENIGLSWHPGHSLWKVRVDPSQIDQLLANLAVNARDAIGKSGTISIETSNTTCDEVYCADQPDCAPGDYVMLAVSDDGCGMDKKTIANIFEPFFTTKREGQGTGLGLATVYGIVRQNNGFVNVYSEPERGATFKIYLPRNTEGDEQSVDEQEDNGIPGGNETILIVEDEKTVLNLSQAMLEVLGYKVLAAGTKDMAFSLVSQHSGKIDLLLTDVVMPDMNGKELSEQIMAVKPGMKCLYMSGYTADVIASQGMLQEGIHFISKPFSLKDLAFKVREALER